MTLRLMQRTFGLRSGGAASVRALAPFRGVALVLALGACSSSPAEESTAAEPGVGQSEQPLVGAETDAEHTAVLAVVASLRRSEALCTGTLIAPNLVLTA